MHVCTTSQILTNIVSPKDHLAWQRHMLWNMGKGGHQQHCPHMCDWIHTYPPPPTLALCQPPPPPGCTHATHTQYTHHGHKWGDGVRGPRMRSPQGGLSAATNRRKVVRCPRREATPQVDILGPKSRRWGGVPHRRYGSSTWTPLVNGKGLLCCPLLCGPDTEQ